jgi:hypothetical protein
MPRGKGIYDDEDAEAQSEGQDRNGDPASDMASEENTPDVAKTDQEPTA